MYDGVLWLEPKTGSNIFIKNVQLGWSRVTTRLGEFSPIGRVFALSNILKNCRNGPNFGATFSTEIPTPRSIWSKMGKEVFWAIFSNTHLVSLFGRTQNCNSKDSFLDYKAYNVHSNTNFSKVFKSPCPPPTPSWPVFQEKISNAPTPGQKGTSAREGLLPTTLSGAYPTKSYKYWFTYICNYI
jgi:hypothetical protein